MADMEGLRRNFDALREDINGNMEEIMDEREVGGYKYHTKKVLEAIVESRIWMEFLVDSSIYSNGALLSDSEGEEIFPFSILEDEESIVIAVDEKEKSDEQ